MTQQILFHADLGVVGGQGGEGDRALRSGEPPSLHPSSHPPAAAPACGRGYWSTWRHRETLEYAHIRHTCKRMDCAPCAGRRQAKVFAQAVAGEPDRAIVLTTIPVPGMTLARAIRRDRRYIARYRRWIRSTFGPSQFFMLWELHESGWPHWHLLHRGPYLPQWQLSQKWKEMTGAHRVHVKRYRRPEQAAHEVTKYLLKTYATMPAYCRRLRLVTMTRGWILPENKPPTMTDLGWEFLWTTGPGARTFEQNVERLNATLVPSPDAPGLCFIRCHGPPDPQILGTMRDLGDRTARRVAALLQLELHPDRGRRVSIERLRDQLDFQTDPRDPWKC
ncbi:hypothetical protein ES703_91708 [subsurface metagenome]